MAMPGCWSVLQSDRRNCCVWPSCRFRIWIDPNISPFWSLRNWVMIMIAVGFEPTQLALVELESTPLDHSGKLSWVAFTVNQMMLKDCPYSCSACSIPSVFCFLIVHCSGNFIGWGLWQMPDFARSSFSGCDCSATKSGHPESNQGPSDGCMNLQSDALPTELWPACGLKFNKT